MNCNVNDNGFISNNDGLATKLDLAKLQLLINQLREDLDNGFETFPISTIIPFAGNGAIPSGFLLCDGSSISRKEYVALYKCIGDLYGAEDDEHFNLPDLRDKFVKGGYVAGSQKTVDTNGTSPVLTMRYIIKAEEAGGNIDDITRLVEEWLASHAAIISGKGSVWTYDKVLGGFRPKTMDEISSVDIDSSDEKVIDIVNRMAFPPGTIIPFAGNGDIPVGFLLCNGASVLRETYPDLFDVIGTTYGAVDELHFNLPNLNDRFVEGSDVAGTVKEAGLPNITGNLNNNLASCYQNQKFNGTGAFDKSTESIFVTWTETGNSDIVGTNNAIFDASRSNSIYGNSDTVQPNSLTMKYIIKAFGCANNIEDVDITQIANEVNDVDVRKIDKSAVKSYVVESVVNDDGSWYRKYSDGWVEQGGIIAETYTVNLLKPMANNKYYATIIIIGPYVTNYDIHVDNKTNTSFQWTQIHYTCNWYACGMGAD